MDDKTRQVLANVAFRLRHASDELESLTQQWIRASEGVVKESDQAAVDEFIHKMESPRAKSGFVFGKASLKELEGVKSELVQMSHRALELSVQDFCVYDGLRTVKEQEQHVKNGTSKTMHSKHLKGLAVDLVPWINGKPTWDWDGCYRVAVAVDQAATEMGIAHKIRWGGAWDRLMIDFGGDAKEYVKVVQEYSARQKSKGLKAFIDGPHYEWVD